MLSICLSVIDSPSDIERFTNLYNKYKGLMYYQSSKYLITREDREDAVQEAFLRIAKNFGKVGSIQDKKTRNFCLVIVTNICKDMLAKDINKEENIPFDIIEDTFLSETDFENVKYDDLKEALSLLDDKYRNVLYLNIVYSYTLAETSVLLGISHETAKKRLQRAKFQLRKILEKRGNYNE